MLSRRRGLAAIVPTAALVVAAGVSLPLLYTLLRLLEAPHDALRLWSAEPTLTLVGRTLALVCGSVLCSLALALPAAWLVARTDLAARRLWAVLAALPLVFPTYVAAFSLIVVAGPTGLAQRALAPLGVDRLPPFVYGYGGALIVLALFSYPYVYLLTVGALRSLDPALEESARTLGASPWRSFATVVLPQLRSPLLAGSLLVALYALSDFGAVSLTRYDTLTLQIFNDYGRFDRGAAAAHAALLACVALATIALYALALRGIRPVRRRAARPAPRARLGRWQLPAQLLLATIVLPGVALPLTAILYWATRAIGRSQAVAALLEAARGSLLAAALAAVAAAILALPVAIWSVRRPGWWSRATERISYAGYALPGLVVALSLVFLAIGTPLYQTLTLLVAAYVVRFLPEAVSATRSALADVAPTFEEAARSLGRGPLATLCAVTLPLIRGGVLAGLGLVFMTTMKELPATLILRPIGFETLAVRIWSAAEDGAYGEAALPSLLLVLVSAVPIFLLVIRPALRAREGEV